MRRARLLLLAAGCVLVAACSRSSEPSEGSATTSPSPSASVAWAPGDQVSEYDREAYCAQATNLQVVAAAEPQDFEQVLSLTEQIFEIQGAMAALAPTEVRSSHQSLADAGAALRAGFEERGPLTEENFAEITQSLIAEIDAEYGDLTPATALVGAFVKDQCGITINP